MSELRVIGLGCPLMGDDGVGLAVLAALLQRDLPQGVELVDGGTAGHVLLELLAGADRAILIDAVEKVLSPKASDVLLWGRSRLPMLPAYLCIRGACPGPVAWPRDGSVAERVDRDRHPAAAG
ncbi:MAG TPA: hydrogenase maturation protease [Geothermobacteraceae bacterium]|nr:hydrogenase maturation protease [Geothermobacteraceae bacterium]